MKNGSVIFYFKRPGHVSILPGSQTRGDHEPRHTKSNRESSDEERSSAEEHRISDQPFKKQLHKVNQQPGAGDLKHGHDRYHLHFLRESREEIDRKKLESQTDIIIPVSAKDMEACIEDIYQPGSGWSLSFISV